MKVFLTRATTVQPFAAFLEAGGGDVSRLLVDAGIPSEILYSPESLIPLSTAGDFTDKGARREGINNLGFRAGEQTQPRDLGLFGMVLHQSLNLKELLSKLVQWVPLTDSGAQAWMQTNDRDPANLDLCIRHHIGTGRSVANDFGMMILLNSVRLALGPKWKPREASVDLTRRSAISKIESLSEARLSHNPDYTGFSIPRKYLAQPIVRSGRLAPLDPKVAREVNYDQLPEDLVGSVVRAIKARLGLGILTIEEVAELVGTSVRSLQRGLSEEGTVYRGLVDRVRYEESLGLLSDPGNSVSDIATRLGYSDAANFSHAFRRWTGMPPKKFRLASLR